MAAPYHQDAGGVHPFARWQDTDPITTVSSPDAVVAKSTWVDTGGGFFRIKQRNDDNDGWILVGFLGAPPARTVSAAGDPMVDTDELVFLDPTTSSFNFNLIAIANRSGKRTLKYKNIADPDTSVNTVTLIPDGTELVNGKPNLVVQPGDSGELSIRNSTTWEVIK